MKAKLSRMTAVGVMALLTAPPGARQSVAAVSGPSQHRAIRTLEEKLQTVVPDFDTSGKPMTNLLLDLAYKYQLPMGIEYATAEAVHKPLNLRFKRRTLKDIITRVVEAVPGFQVDYSGGLVDIYSLQARLDPSNPFNTTIHAFDVSNLEMWGADDELFCALGRQLDPHSGCGHIGPVHLSHVKITLHLQNKKVYEVLNAIVAQDGKAVWTPKFPLPRKLAGNLTNFWRIYPFGPYFESDAVQSLEAAFPRSATEGAH